MITFPQKVITIPQKVTFHPRLVNNISKMNFYLKICWFMHFCCQNVASCIYVFFSCQIHQSVRIGGGWGSSQSWQCQDFERFLYSRPSLIAVFYQVEAQNCFAASIKSPWRKGKWKLEDKANAFEDTKDRNVQNELFVCDLHLRSLEKERSPAQSTVGPPHPHPPLLGISTIFYRINLVKLEIFGWF